MIVTMIRSSALSTYIDMCEQQYFITYSLGHPSPGNLKSDIGSAGHLVLEWLSLLKIQYDEGKDILSLKTKAVEVEFNREDLYAVSQLSNSDIDKINKSRKNKQIYKPDAVLEYGHTRIGSKVVNTLINASYKYFSETVSPQHDWTQATFKQTWNCVWMALEQNKRIYDPRFRKIIQPEEHFNIEIKKPWSKYSYFLNGKKIEGNLTLKGTIDLVTEVDSNTIEIIDWKFGRMFNFGKNQDKTYETLQKDIQLMFYYYAAKQIFPQYENIIITINFIRDGGPQTICFDKSDYLEIEKKIEETFTEIKNNNSPKLLDPTYKDHRCNKFCYFYKKKVEGKPFCAHIKDRIEEFGIDYVTETETADGFTIGHYEAPGE